MSEGTIISLSEENSALNSGSAPSPLNRSSCFIITVLLVTADSGMLAGAEAVSVDSAMSHSDTCVPKSTFPSGTSRWLTSMRSGNALSISYSFDILTSSCFFKNCFRAPMAYCDRSSLLYSVLSPLRYISIVFSSSIARPAAGSSTTTLKRLSDGTPLSGDTPTG